MKDEILEQYKALNWNSLLRKELGDAGRLDNAKDTLDRIRTFLDRFINSELVNTLPEPAIREIENNIKNFIDFANNTILTFSDTSQKPEVIKQIEQKEFNIISALGKYSTYLDAIGLRDNKEEELRLKKLKDQEKEINEILNTVKEISERAKTIAQGEEAKKFGNDFEEQAGKHEKNATKSFYAMFGSVVVTVITALVMFIGNTTRFDLVTGLSTWQSILKFVSEQNIFLYIIIFSLLSFLISHFSRNYSSEKNLENVYLQKQRALDSHKQILDSVQGTDSQNDLETQNALLAYMAKAIFETKETGYLKGVKHNTNPSGPVLDMTKAK